MDFGLAEESFIKPTIYAKKHLKDEMQMVVRQILHYNYPEKSCFQL